MPTTGAIRGAPVGTQPQQVVSNTATQPVAIQIPKAQVDAQVGVTQTVFYKVTNHSDRTVTGIATYNITPEQSAAYFVKIQCFCFTEHTLKPGESFEAPVVFYIDPEIADNRELDSIKAITLSYTYFASKAGQPVAEDRAGTAKGDAKNPKL